MESGIVKLVLLRSYKLQLSYKLKESCKQQAIPCKKMQLSYKLYVTTN